MEPKYSKEIYGDDDAYYMGCPEVVSRYLSKRLSRFESAVELCCGAGMICVQLAKEIDKVVGVDIKKRRVENARKNAKLYGVSGNTEFVVGDATDENLLKNLSAEVVILEPDWSSGGDKDEHVSKLEGTQPSSPKLFQLARKHITKNIVFRAPKTFSIGTLQKLGDCHVENVRWNSELKFKLAYYFDICRNKREKNVYFDPEALTED